MYNYRGPFGMSSGQSQEYKGLVFNLFLKYVLRFIQTWSDLFLPEQFEVWELNGRWIWELKLRRDDSFVEMLQDPEFLRTGRMYFLRNCAYCGFEYICRTVVWLQQQALRWEAARLRLQLKELRTWTGWKNLLWRWRLWQFLRTGKICIYFENCSDCGLEKLQDLRCDCMLCAEIGSLASRGEALFDHEELAKCWRFKAWSSVDILTSLVCV